MAGGRVLDRDLPGLREWVGWGAFAGLVMGLPVGGLMAFQGMLRDGGRSETLAWVLFLTYATAAGVAIGLFAPRTRGLALAATGGVMIGLLSWLLFSLTVDPVLHGRAPTWSVSAAAAAYRDLVGDLLHGGLTGVLVYALWSRWARRPRPASPPAGMQEPAQVVIVGGGFAALGAAKRFEQLALRGHRIDVTLISRSNFQLFTPMLAEVASGALEPAHISTPIRAAVAHTRFRHATVDDVDTLARTVRLGGTVAPELIPYDHLVLAVGSVPHFLGLPGVEEHAHTLKDLPDAMLLRDHVIRLLERADHNEPDPLERQRLLTFVVAGGGFAGAETIAELFDLVHGVLHYFPGISPREP
ncbi:MAG: FAD-dependent oxidoreductase, partial [Nakamurella sp.]